MYRRISDGVFQSTLSVRRATQLTAAKPDSSNISIHALRKESDPLSPFGRAPRKRISIHALRKESDRTHESAMSVQ